MNILEEYKLFCAKLNRKLKNEFELAMIKEETVVGYQAKTQEPPKIRQIQ